MTIIKNFEPEQQTKKVSKKYIGLTILSLIFLTTLEIWASNTVVAFGEKFDNLATLKKTLQMENQILENDIARHSSLNNVASQSASLGFSKIESIQYIR